MKKIYEIAQKALPDCANGNNSCIYATVDLSKVIGTVLSMYAEMLKKVHLFKVKLTVNEQDNSIYGIATSFTSHHKDPIMEFVYDTTGIFYDAKVQSGFVSTLAKTILTAKDRVAKEYNDHLITRLGINIEGSIDDLISIEYHTDDISEDQKIDINNINMTNYENYWYRINSIDNQETIVKFDNINSDPHKNDKKINEILNLYFKTLFSDELDDAIIQCEFKVKITNDIEFIATNIFETHYILGEKMLAIDAIYGDGNNEILPPEICKYSMDTKELGKIVSNVLFSTFKLLNKVSSNLVNVEVKYIVNHNDGIYV